MDKGPGGEVERVLGHGPGDDWPRERRYERVLPFVEGIREDRSCALHLGERVLPVYENDVVRSGDSGSGD